MFNSQKINNDPFPYVSESGTRHANPGWLNSEYFSNRRGRAEYDNNPNPILTDFREIYPDYMDARDMIRWVRHVEESDPVTRSRDYGRITDAHIRHGRRVLEKLVNVYG